MSKIKKSRNLNDFKTVQHNFPTRRRYAAHCQTQGIPPAQPQRPPRDLRSPNASNRRKFPRQHGAFIP